MTAIISIGFKTEAFVAGGGTIPAFSHTPAPNDFDRLIDTVKSAIRDSGHVIAVYPEYAAEPLLARLETVRTALNTSKLAPYGTKLPPLAGAGLTSLASAVAPYIKAPGVLFAALPNLEAELVVLAWLGSVSRLHNPSPSLGQHILSMWPTSAFAVSFWPEPTVKTLRKNDRSLSLPTTFRPMMLATAPRDGADATWVEEVILPGLGMPPTVRFDPTPLGPAGGAHPVWLRPSRTRLTFRSSRAGSRRASRRFCVAGAETPSRAGIARSAAWTSHGRPWSEAPHESTPTQRRPASDPCHHRRVAVFFSVSSYVIGDGSAGGRPQAPGPATEHPGDRVPAASRRIGRGG